MPTWASPRNHPTLSAKVFTKALAYRSFLDVKCAFPMMSRAGNIKARGKVAGQMNDLGAGCLAPSPRTAWYVRPTRQRYGGVMWCRCEADIAVMPV